MPFYPPRQVTEQWSLENPNSELGRSNRIGKLSAVPTVVLAAIQIKKLSGN